MINVIHINTMAMLIQVLIVFQLIIIDLIDETDFIRISNEKEVMSYLMKSEKKISDGFQKKLIEKMEKVFLKNK